MSAAFSLQEGLSSPPPPPRTLSPAASSLPAPSKPIRVEKCYIMQPVSEAEKDVGYAASLLQRAIEAETVFTLRGRQNLKEPIWVCDTDLKSLADLQEQARVLTTNDTSEQAFSNTATGLDLGAFSAESSRAAETSVGIYIPAVAYALPFTSGKKIAKTLSFKFSKEAKIASEHAPGFLSALPCDNSSTAEAVRNRLIQYKHVMRTSADKPFLWSERFFIDGTLIVNATDQESVGKPQEIPGIEVYVSIKAQPVSSEDLGESAPTATASTAGKPGADGFADMVANLSVAEPVE